jgi:hypothetical protein
MVIKYKLKRLEKYMKLEDVKAVTAEIQEWSKLD